MSKKRYTYIALFLILSMLLTSCSQKQDSISDKLIRFHVIANSDTPDDQNLKLMVRDSVLKEIGPKLDESPSKEESKNILKQNLSLIKACAEKEILKYGKDYNVSVILGKSIFPTKVYSTIALPAGEYDALKIVIGKGEGKNWWCVMFPPLCFIDITRGVTSGDTEDRLKTVLNSEEYKSILDNNSKDKLNEAVKKPINGENSQVEKVTLKKQEDVEIKFKSVEIAKTIIDKVESIFEKK